MSSPDAEFRDAWLARMREQYPHPCKCGHRYENHGPGRKVLRAKHKTVVRDGNSICHERCECRAYTVVAAFERAREPAWRER